MIFAEKLSERLRSIIRIKGDRSMKGPGIKGLTIFIIGMALISHSGCGKNRQSPKPKENDGYIVSSQQLYVPGASMAPGFVIDTPGIKLVEPEPFFEFQMEQIKTMVSYQKKILAVIKSSGNDEKAIREKAEIAGQEAEREFNKLFEEYKDKYSISKFDLEVAVQHPKAKAELQKYLDEHPRTQKKLDQLTRTLREQMEQTNAESARQGLRQDFAIIPHPSQGATSAP